MNREGLRFARIFRQVRGLREVRQCDLSTIAAQDGIEILEFEDPNPGCTACLYPNLFGDGGAIFLQPGQSSGRRRFSIAHELAHYHIPTHEKQGRSCEELALQATADYGRRVEWEANSFAAELLMPTVPFRRDARDTDVCFDTVYELMSERLYNVSATAAARRLVQTTRETCALVATRNGRVEWQERAEFYFRMATRGQRIGPSTIATAVHRGEAPNAWAEEVDQAAWLDEPQRGRFTLLESTHRIPSLGQVLSLLWIPDLDE
jgi:Zn-dependent peptidase ImmA (M78 family)